MLTSSDVKTLPGEVQLALHLIGKTLIHVKYNSTGDGFVLLFGDSSKATSGQVMYLELVAKGDRAEINMYCQGEWKDNEVVVAGPT